MSPTDRQSQATSESWPHKLNKALIAVGVIAFGLIVTDRLLEVFRAEDEPQEAVILEGSVDDLALVSTTSSLVADVTVLPAVSGGKAAKEMSPIEPIVLSPAVASASPLPLAKPEVVEDEEPVVVTSIDQAGVSLSDSSPVDINEKDALVTLENMFGSRVVFVSASESAYVLTEDERRFEVGSAVNGTTILAAVTTQQLILEQAGERMIISLPDPIVR